MQLKKYEIKTYVTKELHQRVTQEAVTRKTTMAKIIRDGLTEYFLLREELATAIETPGYIGDSHAGKIIHTLLARSEQRSALLIEQLEKQIILTQEQVDIIIAMIDRFHLNLMQYLPRIPERMLHDAIETAKIRHKHWLDEIQKVLRVKN